MFRHGLLMALAVLAVIVIVEGLWAIDFAVTFGGCHLFIPLDGFWDVPWNMATCLNSRYWTVTLAAWYLAVLAIWGVFRAWRDAHAEQ